MRKLILFLTTSFIIRVLIWIPLRFLFLRLFGFYVGSYLFNFFVGLLFLYFLERLFVLFQEDDGRGLIGVFIPAWIEQPFAKVFWQITRPVRKQWFIYKHGYSPQVQPKKEPVQN